jgi:hypothetical protein
VDEEDLDDSGKSILVRVMHLHGANDDITTCYRTVEDFASTFVKWFHVQVKVVVCIIDYPGYDNKGNAELLGTPALDDQIEDLWHEFLKKYPKGGFKMDYNVVWSYSIGTHYACRLCVRRKHEIDRLLLTAPFNHISDSCSYMFSSLYNGREGDGISCLPPKMDKPHISMYFGGMDDVFPPNVVLPLVKAKAHEWVVDETASHRWFTSLVGAQVIAAWLGMAVDRFYTLNSDSSSDSHKSEVSSSVED